MTSAQGLTVTDGGTYDGKPFPATGTATGAGGVTVAGSFTFTYYVGTGTNGTTLGAAAPTAAGTYTVVAAFTSSNTDYGNGTAQDTFSISPAAPTLKVSDGGTYNGKPFPATGTATGAGGVTVAGSLIFTYYVGSGTSGTKLGPPRRPPSAPTRLSPSLPAATRTTRTAPPRTPSPSARPRRLRASATRAGPTTAARSRRRRRPRASAVSPWPVASASPITAAPARTASAWAPPRRP